MLQKKWKEKKGGNSGLIIIGAFIVLSIILAADHLFNLPRLLSGTPPEQFEWVELIFDIVAIFCIGLISFILIRKSEAGRGKIEQVFQIQRDLSLSLSGVTDLKEGLRLCLESALDLSGMDGGGIYLYEQTTGSLNLVFQKELSPDFAKVVSHYEAESANFRLVMQGKPVYAQYQTIGLSLTETERSEGLKALAVIPIKHENQIIGCFNIASRSVEEIPLFARQSLEMIAAQTGSSIARLRMEAELHESEERFRQLAENIDQVFWLTDWDAKRLLYVNPAYERLYGRSCQSAYDNRMSWQDVIHPEDRARVKEAFARSADLGQYVEAEYRVVRDDGTERWVLDRSYPIRDKYGRIYRFASVAEDITERKQQEEELEKSAQLLKDTGEMAKVGGWELDLSTKEVLWTEEVGRIHGVEPGYKPKLEEAMNFYAPESRPALELVLKKAMETGEPYDLESLFIPSGSKDKIWVRSLGRAVYSGGKIVKLTGTFQNIDKYKRAEEALRESEEKYRALIEAAGRAGEGIIIIQDNGVEEAAFVFVNDEFCRMSGYSREELLGRSAWDFVPHEIAVRLRDWYKRRHMGESLTGHYEAAGVHKDGTIVPLELSIVTMPWQGNIATVLYIRNITERKKAEEALRESQAKLQSIFSAAPAGIGMTINQTIGELNTRLCEITGYSKEELFGKSISGIYPSDQDYLSARSEIYDQLREKGYSTIEASWKRKDGRLISVLLNCALLKLGDFSQGITFTVLDITERKKAEEEIRTERDKLENVTRNIGVGLAIISRDYQTVWANDVLKQIFGEVEGKLCYNTYNGRSDICPGCGVREVFEQGKDVSVHEQVGKDKDGNTIWSQIIATPLRDKEGNITAAMEVVVPITERKKAEEELRTSEEKYRAIVENATDQIFTLDRQCRFLAINKTAAEISRKSVSEMVGKSILQIFSKETAAQLSKNIEEVFETGQSKFIEERMCLGGKEFYSSATLNPIKDDTRNVVAVTGIVRDITERKKAEEALRESEERYRVIFESSVVGILVADIETKEFKYANPALCRMLGYTEDELKQMSVADIHPKEELEYVISEFEAQSKGEKTLTQDIPCLRKDGTIIYADINTTKVTLDGREYNVGFFKDVTERKRAEEALRESEQRYRGVVDNIGIGVSLISPNLEIIFLNEQMKKWFPNVDISKEAICYRAFNSPPREEACSYCPTNKTLQDGRVHESITETPTGDKIINYKVVSSPIKDLQGNVIAAIEMVEDITEMKRLQEQLIQSEKLAAVGTLAYGIAHEFNNILAGMMANAELGLISKEHEQIKECFEIIVDNSHRASSITNNLLAFARHKDARKELVDITESLKSVLAITHRELEKYNIEVIEKFKPVPKVYCDPGQFSEVFLNMITNARDAMHPKGGTLIIQVESAGDCMRIIFKDTGCGIPEEIKGRIFEPFVTTKGALGKSEVPGTGLGLFLTYGIINGYKGKIEVETKVGKGTKFSIIIPISENQPPELLLDTRIESSKETEKKLKILLVDDEKAIILGLKKFLESKGHKVSTSLRAKEGLEIFRKGQFDLVLSDITIPDMDGIELIKKVKEKNPQAKIIVITGHLQKEKEEKAMEAGADEVLIKPFRNELLYQTISKVVD